MALEPEIISTIKVEGNGRITIAAEIRKAYDIKKGDKVHWVKVGGEFCIRPTKMPKSPIRTEHGPLKKS